MRASRPIVVSLAALLAGCSAGASAAGAMPTQAAQLPAGASAATAPRATGGSTTDTSFADHLRGTRHAKQIVVVTARGYGRSHAKLEAFRRRHGRWHHRFGSWRARIGENGFAPQGDKREGDLRTPSGSFRFPFMFGVAPNPGVRFRYRRARSTSRWDDDSASANYNRWVDTRTGNPGRNPENMKTLPQYKYGVVVGYNLADKPGKGSAIFLHVTDHRATLGCIAIGRPRLLRLLRWLRPGLRPRIIMGTRAAVQK